MNKKKQLRLVDQHNALVHHQLTRLDVSLKAVPSGQHPVHAILNDEVVLEWYGLRCQLQQAVQRLRKVEPWLSLEEQHVVQVWMSEPLAEDIQRVLFDYHQLDVNDAKKVKVDPSGGDSSKFDIDPNTSEMNREEARAQEELLEEEKQVRLAIGKQNLQEEINNGFIPDPNQDPEENLDPLVKILERSGYTRAVRELLGYRKGMFSRKIMSMMRLLGVLQREGVVPEQDGRTFFNKMWAQFLGRDDLLTSLSKKQLATGPHEPYRSVRDFRTSVNGGRRFPVATVEYWLRLDNGSIAQQRGKVTAAQATFLTHYKEKFDELVRREDGTGVPGAVAHLLKRVTNYRTAVEKLVQTFANQMGYISENRTNKLLADGFFVDFGWARVQRSMFVLYRAALILENVRIKKEIIFATTREYVVFITFLVDILVAMRHIAVQINRLFVPYEYILKEKKNEARRVRFKDLGELDYFTDNYLDVFIDKCLDLKAFKKELPELILHRYKPDFLKSQTKDLERILMRFYAFLRAREEPPESFLKMQEKFRNDPTLAKGPAFTTEQCYVSMGNPRLWYSVLRDFFTFMAEPFFACSNIVTTIAGWIGAKNMLKEFTRGFKRGALWGLGSAAVPAIAEAVGNAGAAVAIWGADKLNSLGQEYVVAAQLYNQVRYTGDFALQGLPADVGRVPGAVLANQQIIERIIVRLQVLLPGLHDTALNNANARKVLLNAILRMISWAGGDVRAIGGQRWLEDAINNRNADLVQRLVANRRLRQFRYAGQDAGDNLWVVADNIRQNLVGEALALEAGELTVPVAIHRGVSWGYFYGAAGLGLGWEFYNYTPHGRPTDGDENTNLALCGSYMLGAGVGFAGAYGAARGWSANLITATASQLGFFTMKYTYELVAFLAPKLLGGPFGFLFKGVASIASLNVALGVLGVGVLFIVGRAIYQTYNKWYRDRSWTTTKRNELTDIFGETWFASQQSVLDSMADYERLIHRTNPRWRNEEEPAFPFDPMDTTGGAFWVEDHQRVQIEELFDDEPVPERFKTTTTDYAILELEYDFHEHTDTPGDHYYDSMDPTFVTDKDFQTQGEAC